MIKMAGRDDKTGRGIIILGIDESNVRVLKMGNPIHIFADDLGFKGEIVIHYESTLDKLKKKLKHLIGPNTAVTDNRGQKKN